MGDSHVTKVGIQDKYLLDISDGINWHAIKKTVYKVIFVIIIKNKDIILPNIMNTIS